MHSLDFEMVAQVLRQFNYSGEVHANISPQTGIKDGGRVVLTVKNGHILSCFILNKNGLKLFHDQEAYHLLARLGILDWELTPFSSSPPSATPARPAGIAQPPPISPAPMVPPQTNRSSYPRRLAVSPAQTRNWSMLERYVYMLCDGTHTYEQLAALLSRSLAQIERAVEDLRLSGAIEME